MNAAQLLARVKTIYGSDIPFTDTEIAEYISIAEEEIVSWEYSLIGIPETAVDTSQYDNIKVMAVISGLTQHGAEGEAQHTEGAVTRQFVYSDMIDYIHKHIAPFCGVGR